MGKNKLDCLPEQEATAIRVRIEELRELGMSWTGIARVIFKEFGLSLTHPTVKRIHTLTSDRGEG